MYWDTLNLAMMQELEDTGLFDEVDLRAWQRLISQFNEYMFMGYSQARDLITNEVDSTNNNEENITTSLYYLTRSRTDE
jgi:hypothetical protein